nr:hypothetical protein [Angustibacter aerolatus]
MRWPSPAPPACSLTTGSNEGSGPSTSKPGSAVFHRLLDEQHRGLRRHLREPHLTGQARQPPHRCQRARTWPRAG